MTPKDIEYRKLVDFFNAYFTDQKVATSDRPSLVIQALAKTIAFTVTVPSAPVNNPQLWYTEHAVVYVNTLVSELNETYPVDIEMVKTISYQAWMVRYNIVHDLTGVNWNQLCKLSKRNFIPEIMKRENVPNATKIIDLVSQVINNRLMRN